HRASPDARVALERALAALGAEVFPKPGEALAAGASEAAVSVKNVYADGAPSGTVVRVSESGLRRGDRILRRAQVEVSRGPMSKALSLLSELAGNSELPESARSQVAALAARLEALPREKHDDEDGDRVLAETLAVLEASAEVSPCEALGSLRERVVSGLRERGYVVSPDSPGGTVDSLKTILGSEAAIEAPKRRFADGTVGDILAVERRAVVKAALVLSKARVVVCAGPPNELHSAVSEVREKLGAENAEKPVLAELDEVLEKIAEAKPDRAHLLAFPVMNVLHRLGAKDRLGGGLKTYLRGKHVKEIVAYANYPAAELGPKQLEEVRVSSDRDKGKIVRVLRPGFIEEKTGVVLQKVQAEVSR
ncbi:hypothetical protein HY251_21345, partial [bacterium]|nr:hypothetical protein [bacterium]